MNLYRVTYVSDLIVWVGADSYKNAQKIAESWREEHGYKNEILHRICVIESAKEVAYFTKANVWGKFLLGGATSKIYETETQKRDKERCNAIGCSGGKIMLSYSSVDCVDCGGSGFG